MTTAAPSADLPTTSRPGSAAGGRAIRGRPRLAALVLAVLGVLLVARLAVAEPFAISSRSMAPTLSRGDHVLVDKLAYRGGAAPRRGDLVVFHAPGSGEIMLKRVVALGGDTVALEDGALLVNGERHIEPYADPDAIDSVYFGPVTVKPGSVFVLGDNRAESKDSRAFGFVPTTDLIGRARARVWPPSRWAGLQ